MSGAASENRNRRRLIAESNRQVDEQIQREAFRLVASGQRPPRPPLLKPQSSITTRREVRVWMRLYAEEYDTETALVEGLNAALDIPQEWMDDDTHWIWDEAVLAKEQA